MSNVDISRILDTRSRIVWCLVFLIILMLKYPILDLPYHWDGLFYVVPNAVWTAEHDLNPLHPINDYGHPPLLYEILAIAYILFGESPAISHLVIICFSFLGVYYTYRLGSYLYNKRIGIYSAALLFFSPMYFAQSGLVLMSVPLTALGVATVYYALRGDKIGYLMAGSCLVMLQEPGVLTILSVLLYMMIKNYRESGLKSLHIHIKTFLFYSIPLFVFLLWIVYHWSQSGWFFYDRIIDQSPILWFIKFIYIAFILTVPNYGVFFTAVLLAILIINLMEHSERKSKTERFQMPRNSGATLLWITIAAYMCFFSFVSGLMWFLVRYILPVYPLFFILLSASLGSRFRKKTYWVILISIIIFTCNWYDPFMYNCGQFHEVSMHYTCLVNTEKKTMDYVTLNYPNSNILSGWFQRVISESRHSHYVTNPADIHVISVTSSDYSEKDACDVDLIIYSPNIGCDDPHSTNPKILKAIDECNATLIKRFEDRDIFVEIYKLV